MAIPNTQVKSVAVITDLAITYYKEHGYCLCPVCQKGFVRIMETSTRPTVDCKGTIHFFDENAFRADIDNGYKF